MPSNVIEALETIAKYFNEIFLWNKKFYDAFESLSVYVVCIKFDPFLLIIVCSSQLKTSGSSKKNIVFICDKYILAKVLHFVQSHTYKYKFIDS